MPKVDNVKQPPNLPQLEEQILSWWRQTRAFEQSVESRPADRRYVFYDGPPFATGMPHYGHLLASTTKDVIPRYWTMRGYRVDRVWGWDCHGLPIENMIEQQLDIKGGKKGIEALGVDNFNHACELEVMRLDQEWEKVVSRLGRWVDFGHNYKTMDRNFMESVWWGFKQLYEKGLVYEGKKVILYCPRCSTPLSNFEIAMDNSYQEVIEPSTIYKYPVKNQAHTYLLAWSTTPWNKLVTPALAVNPKLTYVKVRQGDEFYILAESRLEEILTDQPYQLVEKLTGQELTQLEFKPHYDFYPHRQPNERFGVVVTDEFVTDEEGTGVVTLAVYGEDDFRVMQREHIQLVEHVDDEGKLKSEVKPWAGLDILAVNPLVNQDLEKRGLIYANHQLRHQVATCYRCHTRLYYAPVPAWFIDVAKLRSQLIAENEKINWYPAHLKHGRFLKGLENAPDWNISRSRYWGTPMPIWEAEVNGQRQRRIIGSLAELQKWAVDPDQIQEITDLHRQHLDEVKIWIDDDRTIQGTQVPEVFDCWVESGSMPFASIHYPFANKDRFENNYPAQFVSEYIAQTRAWFYTMHVISVGIFGQPPFENVLTTGTILAEDGTKMSKSKKNFPDPMVLIDKYGADSLRLYLMSSTVMKGENLSFSEKEVADIRRKVFIIWWNVFAFFKLFADQKVDVTTLPDRPDHILDQWLLSRVQSLIVETTSHLDNYDLIRASRNLIEFVDQLSTWYLRLSRDRLRASGNHQASHVFGYALYTLAQLMAPLTPYFSEVIFHSLVDDKNSIHHTDWPMVTSGLINHQLESQMATAKDVVNQGRAVRADLKLKLRQPLAAARVFSPQPAPNDELVTVIASELNVKQIDWQAADQLRVELNTRLTPELKAEGEARELMRDIQKLRKKACLQLDEQAQVEAPNWPPAWKTEIENRTHVSLRSGPELKLVD